MLMTSSALLNYAEASMLSHFEDLLWEEGYDCEEWNLDKKDNFLLAEAAISQKRTTIPITVPLF